jgi:NADH-quinone oxidoreductase subunit L
VHASHLPGAGFAVFAVTAGVFITAFYSFRMYFLVFHGKERFDTAATHDHHHGHDHHGHHGGPPHESPWVVTLPLALLAIPSLAIGFVAVGPMLHGDFLAGAIHVDARHGAMAELTEHFHGALAMGLHAFATLPFWLAAAGVALAWLLYLVKPAIPAAIAARAGVLYRLLLNKYYLDEIYAFVFAGGARALGRGLWRVGDMAIIDGALVNGSARLVGWLAGAARRVQSGLIYHYAFVMIIGVFALLTLFFVRMA